MLAPKQIAGVQAMIAKGWGFNPAHISHPQGLVRIMIASALFHPAICQQVLALQCEIFAADFLQKPLVQTNFVGSIIAERPVLNDQVFVEGLKLGLRHALASAQINPIFLVQGAIYVNAGLRFAEMEGIDGTRELEEWERNRGRQLRYAQHAHCESVDTVPTTPAELRAAVPKTKRIWFHSSGFSFAPPIGTRSRSTLDQKARNELGHKSVKDLEKATVALTTVNRYDIETSLAMNLAEAESLRDPDSAPKRVFKRPAHRSLRSLYCAAVPPSKGIGAAEVEILIDELIKIVAQPAHRDWDAAAALAIAMAVWVKPHDIKDLKLTEGGKLVASKLSVRVTTAPDAALHRPTVPHFNRPIPQNLVAPLRQLQKTGVPDAERIDAFLKGRHSLVTLARVIQALRYLCPAVFGYHEILAMTGLDPTAEKAPAQRSYIWLDPQVCASGLQWWRQFDQDFAFPDISWPACGSTFTPTLDAVRGFAAAILRLSLSESVTENFEHDRKAMNALAAGIHLLCVVLFGGSRNYPMVVPNQVATPGGWIMAYQKNTYLFSWPERLLPLVARYQARRSELFQSALESGSSIPSSEEFDTAYNLYSVRGKSIITEPICARSLAIALLACEETANWGFLHPGAFRHFPMSEFYASGKFLSHEIEAYHHRFLEELHPLSPARLEDPRMPVTTARMHEYLIQLLRL